MTPVASSFLLAAVLSCTHGQSSHVQSARVRLRDEARLVLERHCGNCHLPESPSALPAALQVYNLREEEWARRMTQAQLENLGERIREGEFFDVLDTHNTGKVPPVNPSDAEQATVRAYIQAELEHRRRAP